MSKDLFSKQANSYARYRPGYPSEMIDYILQFVEKRNAAWDCATGNGQAAIMLAPHFQSVEASDISERQIANAIQDRRIHYSVSNAEATSFQEQSFDLITVAQAYHWFNFTAFEKEVRRVLKSDGIIAIWGYALVSSDYEELNKQLNAFYEDTVGPYWDPERKYLEDHYRSVPFPYNEIESKEFTITQQWSLDDLLGYLNTWSSVQHFIKANGFNPVEELKADLKKLWTDLDVVSFRFPLFLRLGSCNL